jgi:ABC-type uncharacterized transport system permease subunit
VIPGRCRGGWRSALANVASFALLVAGTQLLAQQSSPWEPSAWSNPWSGDVVLIAGTLLFLGLGFLMPLHAGVLNVGIYAQFLAGFAVGGVVARNPAIPDPAVRAGLALIAGTGGGALVGVVLLWLKSRFAVHEILSGLLIGGALLPVAGAAALPDQPLGRPVLLTGAIVILAFGVLVALGFGHVLRASAPGFHLRIVGSNPLAAVAAGVDVDLVQLTMLAAGGACAGLMGAVHLVSQPSVALERWPLPLAFAGITIALYGLASVRGILASSVLFALWLTAPGTLVSLGDPRWVPAVAALLVLPALWILPRLLPDQGAPRALWRTRHRETY